jgi:hypothetical protein
LEVHEEAATVAFADAMTFDYERGPWWSRLLRARALAAMARGADAEALYWWDHAGANDAASELPPARAPQGVAIEATSGITCMSNDRADSR